MPKNEPEQYNDDRIGELGREVAGTALELLLEQLKRVRNTGQASLTAIEAYSNAVGAGLAAMPDEGVGSDD